MNNLEPMTKDELVANKKLVGAHIWNFRTLAGLTQTELARLTGHKSAAYIAFIEDGKRNITAVDLVQVAYYLKVKPTDLLQGFSITTTTKF